ncbi:hypothetical protein IQ283_02165 [Alkalihalobacillus hwajinpoensis]|uniref:hypothetical protein n=1 Tax=Guptibacillus hwajinpoensis TaxID=208199 RepID=UPI001883DDE3|nr:hypothetical protein [Pseudalkalibacillus hwajinpoensis]MBF0705395.1 hypothetical protein [Pseudalkalibacillus hwajinpoensis]
MGAYKKKALSLFLIVMVFITLMIALHWKYNISLETIIQVIGSMFGILIGSYLTGRYAVNSVREQISHNEQQKRDEIESRQSKYNIFLRIHLNLIRNEAKSINSFMNLNAHPVNPYNVDPLEKVENAFLKIKDTISLLFSISPDYISEDNYRLLGEVNNKIYETERAYEGFLATEEEEQRSHFDEVKKLSNQLENLVNVDHDE